MLISIETRLGLVPGSLLRIKEGKSLKGTHLYEMESITKKRDPASVDQFRPWQQYGCKPGDFLLYVRREENMRAWVFYSPSLQKNIVAYNRAFWKAVEVVSHPEKTNSEKENA
jgi:hypothetical protein